MPDILELDLLIGGEFALGDGRTIMKPDRLPLDGDHPTVLPIAEGFRMIVLANRPSAVAEDSFRSVFHVDGHHLEYNVRNIDRHVKALGIPGLHEGCHPGPGYPFLGNDFYRECGDVLASHAIDNPDVASEVELLRSYGPNVPQEHGRSSGLQAVRWCSFPDVQHPAALGSVDSEIFADIFDFDWHDAKLRELLSSVLNDCGFDFESGGVKAKKHGEPNRRLPKDPMGCHEENNGEGFNPGDVGTRDYDDATDHSGKRHAPRAGNWDGRQHIGEGPWDGGSGGTGTEEQKKEVPEEWHRKAQQMADEAYAHRLNELKMSPHDEQEYARLRSAVEAQISAFQLVLQSHEGELDEMQLVDGIAGAKNIYRRRGEAQEPGGDQRLRKRVKFVMDCSGAPGEGSWLGAAIGRGTRYSMVGHSGTGPDAELLVPWGKPPRREQQRPGKVRDPSLGQHIKVSDQVSNELAQASTVESSRFPSAVSSCAMGTLCSAYEEQEGFAINAQGEDPDQEKF
eukprot:Skav205683  [mRNA]  locus=scaffold2655:9275:20729:- [translate_table: standard]